MLHTIQWFVELAFQVVAVLFGIELFICIIRPKTRKKLIHTIDEIVRTIYNWIRSKLSKEEPEKEPEPKATWTINGVEYDDLEKAMKEIERCMLNHEPMQL